MPQLPAFIVQKAKLQPSRVQKKRAERVKREMGDVGTPELHRQMQIEKEVRERTTSGQPRTYGARVKDQTPLDRYFCRQQLSTNKLHNYLLFQAGERLRTDFYYSGLQAHTTSSFEPRITSGITDKSANLKIDALRRYKKAMKEINETLRPILVRVCLNEEPAQQWATQNGQSSESGIVVLRLALRQLASYYGLLKLNENH